MMYHLSNAKLYIYTMLEQFKNHIEDKLSFLKGGRLLVAISGGLDSVVLCQLCFSLKLDFALAHCNFKLRGEESDADESYVLQIAEEQELEVFIQHFETEHYASEHKISTQMAARELRYNWFKELADQLNFDFILTAHHANDDLETFLINLSRGTGLDGLSGIPEINESVIRPLLSFTRDDILDFAREQNLHWREDSSNASLKYLRNKIRHEVIPSIKELNPNFLENFKRTQQHLRATSSIIDDRIDVVSDTIIDIKNDVLYFDIKKLKDLNQPEAYLYQLLKDFEFTDWKAVYELLDAQTGKQVFAKNYCLLKNRDTLILSRISQSEHDTIDINEFQPKIETPIGELSFINAIELSEEGIDVLSKEHTRNRIYVDKDKLIFPLSIKKWTEGDVFYPIGMNGKKKVSKYLKDEKVSLIEKDRAWLLCSENMIVWVIGMRADDRFKVTEHTNQMIKIELH